MSDESTADTATGVVWRLVSRRVAVTMISESPASPTPVSAGTVSAGTAGGASAVAWVGAGAAAGTPAPSGSTDCARAFPLMAAASASNPTPRIANCVDMASSPCVVFSDLQGGGFKIKHDCMFYETRRQPRRGVPLNGCFQRRFDNASGQNIQTRSEARRGGKECVSTCRSRWSQYHSKQNKRNV